MAENLQVTKFKYALSAGANKMFQNQIVFVFTESWSYDWSTVAKGLLNEEHLPFHLQYKYSSMFANCKNELSYPKSQKMCDPIQRHIPIRLL